MSMVKRFTEEQFMERVNYLWQQFHTRPEMQGISYEDFKKECFEEFRKQNQMSDKELDFYRKNNYNNIVRETDKLLTPQEKQKLNEQDQKTITIQDEMKFNNGMNMVNGKDKNL